MDVIYPPYYEAFHCIAGNCPDSCCKEWDVDIDEQTAIFYRNLPGPLGERLRQVLQDTEDGTVMSIQDGRCPMWRKDGLCQIQLELGHSALCQVCQEYPRLHHDYGTFIELGLELSCPEAARLILSASNTPSLVQRVDGGDSPDYDLEAMSVLLQARKIALDIVYDSAHSVPHALILLYLYAHHTQSLLDGTEPPVFDPSKALDLARQFSQPSTIYPIIAFYRQLDILTQEWRTALTTPRPSSNWSDPYRNLIRYFIDRYWLQAISDRDLLCRVKFILISCLLIHTLGGDLIRTAQLYSKEIENSDENRNALLDAAYDCPAFTDAILLGLLLEE